MRAGRCGRLVRRRANRQHAGVAIAAAALVNNAGPDVLGRPCATVQAAASRTRAAVAPRLPAVPSWGRARADHAPAAAPTPRKGREQNMRLLRRLRARRFDRRFRAILRRGISFDLAILLGGRAGW
jgi:hypothetical protein